MCFVCVYVESELGGVGGGFVCERERGREKMCVLGEYFVTDAFIRSIFLSTFKVKLTKGIGRYCVKASPAGFYLRRSYLGQERCVKKKRRKKKMYLHYQMVCISPPGPYFRWSHRGQDRCAKSLYLW